MGGLNFRDACEYDPETYGGEGGAPLAGWRRDAAGPDAAQCCLRLTSEWRGGAAWLLRNGDGFGKSVISAVS